MVGQPGANPRVFNNLRYASVTCRGARTWLHLPFTSAFQHFTGNSLPRPAGLMLRIELNKKTASGTRHSCMKPLLSQAERHLADRFVTCKHHWLEIIAPKKPVAVLAT